MLLVPHLCISIVLDLRTPNAGTAVREEVQQVEVENLDVSQAHQRPNIVIRLGRSTLQLKVLQEFRLVRP